MEHPEKSYKFNPETGDIAIRTRFPDQGALAGMAWLVATSGAGARNASSAEVADWVDIPAPLLESLAAGEPA